MTKAVAIGLVLALAMPARALEPPPPPDDGTTGELGYYERCFGTPTVSGPRFGIAVDMPIPLGETGTSPIPGVASAGKDDKAWLVIVVVAAMALPVVLYVMDKPAPAIVQQRFRCPTFSLDMTGGAVNGHDALGPGSFGFVSTRFSFGVSHFASDFQFDAAPGAVSGFSTHILLRPTPRDHVEGGLAIGYGRSVLGNRVQEGLEIGVPHRYALWRDGLKTFALELRPMLLLGSRAEPSLEAAFLVPLANVLHLRAGGRVYTFQGDLLWGLSAGVGLTL